MYKKERPKPIYYNLLLSLFATILHQHMLSNSEFWDSYKPFVSLAPIKVLLENEENSFWQVWLINGSFSI